MFLKITQRTECRYSRPVQFARIEYRVFPVSGPDQTVLRLSVHVDPSAGMLPCSDFTDAWGNLYRKFEWTDPIDFWKLAVDLHVETLRGNPFDFPGDAAQLPVPRVKEGWPADVQGYLRWEYDPWDNDPDVAAWIAECAASELSSFDKIQRITRMIYQEFEFCKGFTDVKTPPGEILRLKLGVCQDFSTLLVAAARSMGLPARYVSGYIYEGPKANRRESAPASHGWAEVYFPKIGWRGFDPLNGIMTCQTHVRVAQGRWYVDAAPTIGRFIGIGVDQHTQTEIVVDQTDAAGESIEL